MKRALIVSLIAMSTFASEPARSARQDAPKAATVHPVTATLTLPYTELLPGVPFDGIVSITNKTSHRLAVGTRAHLVCESSAPSLDGTEDHNVGEFGDGRETYFEMEKGETSRRVVTWYLSGQPWDWMIELSPPGEYRIALIIEGVGDAEFTGDAHAAGAVRTTDAVLKRIQPEGENATVWTALQEFASGKWPPRGFESLTGGEELAMRIVREYPNSDYYPYALLFSKRAWNESDVPALLDAAEHFPASPALPYLLKRAGDLELFAAHSLRAAGKHVEAAERCRSAESHYSRAAATKGAIREEAAILALVAKRGQEQRTH